MRNICRSIVTCGVLALALTSSQTSCALAADTLPWLSDPFSSQKKADRLIISNLRPPSCPGIPDLKHALHMNEVVIAALCNNPDTKSAYLTLLSQASTYAGNYSGYLPTVTATGSDSRNTTFSKSSVVGGLGSSYGITAGITLYDFGQREFKLEEADQALIAAGYSYNSTLQGAIATTLKTYFQLLTAQNNINVTYEVERYDKASYDAAALRHKIGMAPLSDMLQAKGSYSQAQLSSEQAANTLAQDEAALALLMGLPADAPIKVAEVDASALTRDPFGHRVQELMAEAKQQRNDLRSSRASIAQSKASLEALKRSDLATVSLTANLGQTSNSLSVFNGEATRTQAIGLSVSIPIFTGFLQTYNERTAQEQLSAQEQGLIKSELSVGQDVWNTWQNYQTARQSWDTSRDLLASATELKEVALGRYKEGLGTILDVLNAQSQYSSALQSQLQSRYNLLSTRVDLVRAVGVLDLHNMCPEPIATTIPLTSRVKE